MRGAGPSRFPNYTAARFNGFYERFCIIPHSLLRVLSVARRGADALVLALDRFIERLTLNDKLIALLGLAVVVAALTRLAAPFYFGCGGV